MAIATTPRRRSQKNKSHENPDASLDAKNLASNLMVDNRLLDKMREQFQGASGARRVYDALRLECAVCFEDNIAEKNWSGQRRLPEHIAAKKKNPSAQKALVTKRIKRAERNLHFEPVKFAIFSDQACRLIPLYCSR